jgi:ribosomal protein S20
VKRASLADDRRLRNKSRKSAIATYTKKVRVLPPSFVVHAAVSAHEMPHLPKQAVF